MGPLTERVPLPFGMSGKFAGHGRHHGIRLERREITVRPPGPDMLEALMTGCGPEGLQFIRR